MSDLPLELRADGFVNGVKYLVGISAKGAFFCDGVIFGITLVFGQAEYIFGFK